MFFFYFRQRETVWLHRILQLRVPGFNYAFHVQIVPFLSLKNPTVVALGPLGSCLRDVVKNHPPFNFPDPLFVSLLKDVRLRSVLSAQHSAVLKLPIKLAAREAA